MSKDVMARFDLYQPSKVEDAAALLAKLGKDAWVMAGGNDSLSWFKDRVKQPKSVVDISGIKSLSGIRETKDGVEIGALTSLTDIERNPVIRKKFGLLADAVRRVASPQIRNTGSIGGNVGQDTRCWYYRYGLPCYRAGGNTCYADTPEGMNREHAIFDSNRCVAVTPSDAAPALVALDAKMVIRGGRGERVVDAEKFFIGPAVDITRMTVLKPGEILTAIRIPNTWAGAKFYFEKISDRQSWDFPLVNVAAAMKVSNGTIQQSRIACGGISCTPKRLSVVEEVVKGQKAGENTAMLAGKAAVRGAKALNYNHFKLPLTENLVKRAIRSASA